MHTVADLVFLPSTDLANAFMHILVDTRMSHIATPNPFSQICEHCQVTRYGHLGRCPNLRLLDKMEEVMSRIDDLEATEPQKEVYKQSFILGLEQPRGERPLEEVLDMVIEDLESGQFERKMEEIKARKEVRKDKGRT